jgi:hypothetical protein
MADNKKAAHRWCAAFLMIFDQSMIWITRR